MPKKMMMYYGGFEIEDMFDASQWFTRGMYKTRNIEADGGASNVTMLRSQPKPFTREQLSELPYAAAEAFDASDLESVDTEAFVLNPPELGHRIRYAYSAFAEPNKPEDYYYLYLDLAGRRFAVTFSRDAQSGENLTGKAVKEIIGDYASQAEHRKAFAEIDEFERKAH
ncbi:hypothetical protein NAU58_11500 [Pseudomonas stutzeri]|uniref:Uncharacterized protein n=1 Tax=Stutzerimonas stutzeri TaxID=316 RepID=A0A2N8RXV0_STUST|nr:hypothetical protein [Stutzerimonas stutzeri]MCQ4296208.1 hypothetical protein [Stutzerimonas stutzeri]PNF79207.1 hypothetical protein CXK92_16960 [Stutzerimonas stutzeri]